MTWFEFCKEGKEKGSSSWLAQIAS